MNRDERAKVRDLSVDLRRRSRSPLFLVALCFGRIYSGFERLIALPARRVSRTPALPALDDAAMNRARPRAFAEDYATFDRLSIVYGGLFRGSVIVNYLLGVVAVALTAASSLPEPGFAASSVGIVFPGFAERAVWIEAGCIILVAAIFYYGQTPQDHSSPARRRRGWGRRLAHRWHERWLEYRLLAERFRYIELMLSISPSAVLHPPFKSTERDSAHWYDHYFGWRTTGVSAADVGVHEYRERALALMLEQIQHHDAHSQRRGSVAVRLHRWAVALFFSSLVLCLIDLVAEWCPPSSSMCQWTAFFRENLKSLVLFGAILAPTLSAAIHGILATTEYTKLAESSRETANHIASLVRPVTAFKPVDGPAAPKALKPIGDAVAAFADAAINEASGWRSMLRDKNLPLV